jgi:hypothetical protein
MAEKIQQHMQNKGKEIQERFADVVATLRRNVKEGLQSAVKGEGWTFGRPPSRGVPSGRAPFRARRRPSSQRRRPGRARS